MAVDDSSAARLPVYLDHNATTPLEPRVAAAMLPYFGDTFGNPSSAHAYGLPARQAVERARLQAANLLGCGPSEVVFTSGGTEANNMAIRGVVMALAHRGRHIVISAIEHPAVTRVCADLRSSGFATTAVAVDGYGLVDPRDVERALTPDTVLVSIMHANNEVGTVQPIAEIASLARRRGVVVHSDCAQSVGKVPVRVGDLGADLLSVAGHKMYAPKGVGALIVRSGVSLVPLLSGGQQEGGRRPGTENVPGVVGLGEACQMIAENLGEYANHMRRVRDRLERGIHGLFASAVVNGHPELRLPNTSSVSFPGLQADAILGRLQTVAASAGAACHADHAAGSQVLQAMGVPEQLAAGTLRFSVGRYTTDTDIDRALEDLRSTIASLLRDARS